MVQYRRPADVYKYTHETALRLNQDESIAIHHRQSTAYGVLDYRDEDVQ